MFNLKQAKGRVGSQSAKTAPPEKALEQNRESLDNVADDNPSIHEGLLEKDRKGDVDVPTEAQMDRPKEAGPAQIWEKKIEREKIGELYIPAVPALVEKMIQDRRGEFTGSEKKESGNWTLDPPKQNALLPKWPQIAKQHDKMVLPGDVDRKPNEEPLIGGKIVKASVDNAVLAIKSGATKGYDEQIVSILKQASDEQRDLNEEEKSKINQLKKDRTISFIRKV